MVDRALLSEIQNALNIEPLLFIIKEYLNGLVMQIYLKVDFKNKFYLFL